MGQRFWLDEGRFGPKESDLISPSETSRIAASTHAFCCLVYRMLHRGELAEYQGKSCEVCRRFRQEMQPATFGISIDFLRCIWDDWLEQHKLSSDSDNVLISSHATRCAICRRNDDEVQPKIWSCLIIKVSRCMGESLSV